MIRLIWFEEVDGGLILFLVKDLIILGKEEICPSLVKCCSCGAVEGSLGVAAGILLSCMEFSRNRLGYLDWIFMIKGSLTKVNVKWKFLFQAGGLIMGG